MNGSGVISRVGGWLSHPFTTQMSVAGWFWFTGIILIIAFFWTRVLRHVVEM